jgi:hypothetical protein
VAETRNTQVLWGRYSYLGGTEPNIGPEIIAMSVVLATCVLPPARLLIFAAPSLYAINRMQGRSSLMVSLASLALKSFAVFGGLASYIFFFDTITEYFNALFLLDDEYRGAGSGFAGRDKLWGTAWEYFLKSPLIGNGAVDYGIEPFLPKPQTRGRPWAGR